MLLYITKNECLAHKTRTVFQSLGVKNVNKLKFLTGNLRYCWLKLNFLLNLKIYEINPCHRIYNTNFFPCSVRLILIRGSECGGEFVDHILLELAFASLIFLNGLNNLITQSNVERLKKDLRVCISFFKNKNKNLWLNN